MSKKQRQREPTPLLRVLLPRCPFCDSKQIRPYKRRYFGHFEIRYGRCVSCKRNVNQRVEWPSKAEQTPGDDQNSQ